MVEKRAEFLLLVSSLFCIYSLRIAWNSKNQISNNCITDGEKCSNHAWYRVKLCKYSKQPVYNIIDEFPKNCQSVVSLSRRTYHFLWIGLQWQVRKLDTTILAIYFSGTDIGQTPTYTCLSYSRELSSRKKLILQRRRIEHLIMIHNPKKI